MFQLNVHIQCYNSSCIVFNLYFIVTGLAYQVDTVKVNVGGAPICPRCNERVYFNEEKKAMGKSFHSRCFSCGK